MPTPRTEVSIAPAPARPDDTRVTCRGVSPDPRRAGQACGRLLAIVPDRRFRFVGITARAAEIPTQRLIYVLCTRKGCHVWNVFELLPDPDTVTT